MDDEKRLVSEDRLHYIKQGLRERVIRIYELGWKTSCNFYDLSNTSKEVVVKGLAEKYNFDKDKVSTFIEETFCHNNWFDIQK